MSSVATLHVRNVPTGLYDWLRERAQREGVSINACVIEILAEGSERDREDARAAEILDRWASRGPLLPPGAPDAVDLIRHDRDTR